MKSKKSGTRQAAFLVPKGLSARCQTLWAALVPSRARSPGRLELLTLALRLLDRVDELRATVGSDYVTTNVATRAVHLNPAAKLLTDSEKQLAKIWGQLGLSYDQAVDGRMTQREIELSMTPLDDEVDS